MFISSQASAAKHPVPLDPKADTSTCVQCHEEKTKGKFVHSAMAAGCMSCHEIRVNKVATYVKLTTTTTGKLCLTCHSDKDPAQAKGKVHSPAKRDCIVCHDPHNGDNKNQLREATSGSTAKENICLGCHIIGMNVPASGSRHAALDMGCDTCHVTHKVGQAGNPEFDYHLTKAAPALCLDCHDVKDPALGKAHQNQPFANSNCLSCHDPHVSNSPKLMQAFQHPPFESRSCDTCHQAAKDGKVVLTQKNVKDLCVSCHADKLEQIEKAAVPHPGAAGDCTDCHSPHAAKQPGLPKTSPVEICLTCHTDQAEQGKKPYLHQPAFSQGCATCHAPHGGENKHLLRTAAINDLCLECHRPDLRPERIPQEHALALFKGQVKVPETYFSGIPLIDINKYGVGHPVPNHPVAAGADPTNPKSAPMNCLTCHQPHSSTQKGLLVKDQANNMAFCKSCHTDLTKH
jgi:predicted CXXCH cytochrome family protein